MPIEQIKKEFKEKFNPITPHDEDGFLVGNIGEENYGDMLVWIEQTFKETQKETIKAMLVEEMPEKFAHAPLEGEFSDKLEYGDGFNQCCALQNKKGQEIKDKLK